MEANALADNLGNKLRGMFSEAEAERGAYELQWLEDLMQYKGVYGSNVTIPKGKSQAFVRLMRTKVRTMDSRMGDMLFPAGSQKNWSINPSPISEILPEIKQKFIQGFADEGVTPTEEMIEDAVKEFAKAACKEMESEILDQLKESKYQQVCREVIHDGNLYGTGVLKGPLVEAKTKKKWKAGPNGEYVIDEVSEAKPYFERVSLFDVYPDMSASSVDEAEFVFQRHMMSKSEVRALSRRSDFNSEAIEAYLLQNSKGDSSVKAFESSMRAMDSGSETVKPNNRRYEVIEYWGYADKEFLQEVGIEFKEGDPVSEYEVNVFILGSTSIKAVLNPTRQKSKPYKFFYFEKDETSIYGIGLAQIMADTSEIFNAALRMMLDNAALTTGPQLEVDVDQLAPGQNPTEMHPFKIWLKKSNSMQTDRPLLRTIKIESNTNETMKIMEFTKNLGDEASAVPAYLQGVPAGGAAETMGGLSMLMGASNVTTKDVVKNFDNGITKPAIEDTYHWNMQFNPKESIKGDFVVIPSGSTTLVAKEVRAKALNEFSAVTNNPQDAPLIDRKELLTEMVQALDLPDRLIKEGDDDADEQNKQAQQMIQQLQAEIERLTAEKGTETGLAIANIEKDLEIAEMRYGKDYSENGIEGVTMLDGEHEAEMEAIYQQIQPQQQMPEQQGPMSVPGQGEMNEPSGNAQ